MLTTNPNQRRTVLNLPSKLKRRFENAGYEKTTGVFPMIIKQIIAISKIFKRVCLVMSRA